MQFILYIYILIAALYLGTAAGVFEECAKAGTKPNCMLCGLAVILFFVGMIFEIISVFLSGCAGGRLHVILILPFLEVGAAVLFLGWFMGRVFVKMVNRLK